MKNSLKNEKKFIAILYKQSKILRVKTKLLA